MAKRRKRTNKQVPAKGRLRDICDRLWSRAIVTEWNHRCAVCGHQKCEAHHLVPRQNQATRYDLYNGVALCPKCHKFSPDISPHQNAAAWMTWLVRNQPNLHEWYCDNAWKRFDGQTTAAYYCDVIQKLKEYVEDEDFDRIVGIRFSAWLEEQG